MYIKIVTNGAFAPAHSYQPDVQALETRLRPFVPDFIPAVGDIDAMLKVPFFIYYFFYVRLK